MNEAEKLDLAFAALAHPARRAILAHLATGKATVNVLAEPLDMSLPAVSRHIKVLTHAGLVEQERTAQFRQCRLRPEPLDAVISWADQYRSIWNERLDAMESCLAAMKDSDR